VKPAPFAYVRPASVGEAVTRLADEPDAKLLAGGQSLMPLLAMRIVRPALLVDLLLLPELSGLTWAGPELTVGSMSRQLTVETDPMVRARIPLLAEAIRHVGHPQVRSRGTIGGSIAHLDPTGELPAVALLLGARVELETPTGRRTVPFDEFALGPFTPALELGEIIAALVFPVPRGQPRWAFHEIARRFGDLALALAAGIVGEDGPRVVVSAFGDVPRRVPSLERALATGELHAGDARDAARAALADIEIPGNPIDGSADHSRALVEVTVARVIADLVEPARPAATRDRSRSCSIRQDPVEARSSTASRVDVAADERGIVRLTVNGSPVTARATPRTSLADVLRHDLGLHGTHVGCEHGVCGACTIILDGASTLACLVPAVAADGSAVRTVEGLARGDVLSPLQTAFRERFALQCGFCTPAMLMAATALLESTARPTTEEIEAAIAGVLCRCTGYTPIVDAIGDVAAHHRPSAAPHPQLAGGNP
jgi:xanthine dehydrogenase iron-sulfur cluster and FAD-binding subunit A